MRPITKRLLYILLVIFMVILLDRFSKELATEYLKFGSGKDYLGGLFRLTYAENTGAFLSLGAKATGWLKYLALYLFPSVLLLGLFFYILFDKKMNVLSIFAMSVVLGGGLSNVYDRLVMGKVTDFMVMAIGDLRTGVFNIADVFIMLGLFLMLFLGIKKKEPEEEVNNKLVN